MTLTTLTTYVNLDVDDTYTINQIQLWFNKGIAQYNLIPPLSTYPQIDLAADYTALNDTFMLGIMLPFIVGSVKGSEASISERQVAIQEFLQNARMFKASVPVPINYMVNQQNQDLQEFQLGENVYISDMRRSPVAGQWQTASVFNEIVDDEDSE